MNVIDFYYRSHPHVQRELADEFCRKSPAELQNIVASDKAAKLEIEFVIQVFPSIVCDNAALLIEDDFGYANRNIREQRFPANLRKVFDGYAPAGQPRGDTRDLNLGHIKTAVRTAVV